MLVEDIQDYLMGEGIARVYIGDAPSGLDDVLTIRETPGRAGIRTQERPGVGVEMPRLQFIARASSYATARQTAQDAWAAITVLTGQTIGSSRILDAIAEQPPFWLARDDSEREMIAFNAEIWRDAG